jgi:uncharacterized protein (TIGR04255 family)
MATIQRYSRPPITEAIIDLRVEKAEGLTLAQLEKCHEGEEKAYPTKGTLTLASAQLTLGGQAEAFSHAAANSQIGFLCKNADGGQIFQVSFAGFTVNWLAPYPGWKVLQDEAHRLWNIYRERTRPRKVTRIAVRYINRFDFPGTGVELKEYLLTSPEVSPQLPQHLAGFLMQLAIPQPEIKATLLLSETAVPPPAPNISSIALDIDLFRSDELPEDDTAMWSIFEDLRCRKNEIFEACITDKTRELIR